jgi:hypothetical protein
MANMIPISTVTVGSGGISAIEFTGIPQTYTDLLIKLSLRSNQNANTGENLRLRFNGSSASVYSERSLEGNGSNTTSYSATPIIPHLMPLQTLNFTSQITQAQRLLNLFQQIQ